MSKMHGLWRRASGRVGLRDELDCPQYRLIAPGLTVTTTSVWAWLVLRQVNSSLQSNAQRVADEDRLDAALRPLVGMECHLKMPWGQLTGDHYLEGLGLSTDMPEGVWEWATMRADTIDALDLPHGFSLLGVQLAERADSSSLAKATGMARENIAQADIAAWSQRAQQLQRALEPTLLGARLASPELLSWMVSREFHRGAQIPAGPVEGAALARLTRGRALPMSDHVRLMGADGDVSAYVAVMALTDFPPVMVTPGAEWLSVLNGLETSPIDVEGYDDPLPVQVLAEPSIRFSIPRPRAARKMADDWRASAKDQRKSAAKASAGEPPANVEQAEAEADELLTSLSRGQVTLMRDHPRIVLSGRTRIELDAKIDAVTSLYDSMGITATVVPDDQRDLWLESLPGDRVRVTDLGHVRETVNFAQSRFWDGCSVGPNTPTSPVVGYTTGARAQLVRFLATDSALTHGDAPVIVFTGRTRRGKTVAGLVCMLDMMLAPINQGKDPISMCIDFKGDTVGVIFAARSFGLNAHQYMLHDGMPGLLDTFLTAPTGQEVDFTSAQLNWFLTNRQVHEGGHIIQTCAARVWESHGAAARTYMVLERLAAAAQARGPMSMEAELSETLSAAASSGFGRVILARPQGRDLINFKSGIYVVTAPAQLRLPDVSQAADTWTAMERAAVATLMGALGWGTRMLADERNRYRAKLLFIPEVHLITATPTGRAFLTSMARMGAALGVTLALDTQDVTGIVELPGLTEGISGLFGFAQRSPDEQDQLAQLAGLQKTPEVRAVIAGLDSTSSGELRRGHCVHMDRTGQAATVQWVVPQRVLELLDTSVQGQQNRQSMGSVAASYEYDEVADEPAGAVA